MKGKIVALFLLISLILLICGCAGELGNNYTSVISSDGTSNHSSSTEAESAMLPGDGTTAVSSPGGAVKSTKPGIPETKQNEDVSEFIEMVKTPDSFQKTGENKISDDEDNKYISFIAEKYDVDPERLVAVYAVPDTGNNFVLEFKESYDKNGKLIRSPDNLYKVYKIDAEKNVTIACDDMKYREGVTYWESYFCIVSMQTMIMPQHPDYFNLD